MKQINSFERLQQLIDFMCKFPTREQLVVYLSENICPHGEIAGVNTGYLHDDGVIRIEFFYGFHLSHLSGMTIKIGDDNPRAECLRSMKIVYVDLKKVHENYSQLIEVTGLLDYEVAVGIPVSTRRSYGFTFSTNVQEYEGYREFFECLRSILSFWETTYENRGTMRISSPPIETRELTTRQARILELIKENRTNASIASILGYSESLIRQETIIIYRKLGVDGRRELKKSTVS